MSVMLAGWWLNTAGVPLAGIGDGGAIAGALCVSAVALLVSGVALIAQHRGVSGVEFRVSSFPLRSNISRSNPKPETRTPKPVLRVVRS